MYTNKTALIKTLACNILIMFLWVNSSNAQQSVQGDGNTAIQGSNNQVNSNVHIDKHVTQTKNRSSEEAKKDLANRDYRQIRFEKKKSPKPTRKRLLIMTATNYETQKIHQAASEAGLSIKKDIMNDQVVYSMGTLGGVEIFQIQPGMMGMLEPSSTPLALMSVFKDIQPTYIIATGIAFGRKSKGQKLGEIVVSRQIANYETRKEKNGNIYFRGDKVTSPMLRRINAGIHTWKGAKVHQGLVLSGNVLVNSKEFLNLLCKREPEYVGGDMESYGIYAVSSMMRAQWIMIKGIADWGDGTKNDDYHSIALENVGKFIFHIIKEGNLR